VRKLKEDEFQHKLTTVLLKEQFYYPIVGPIMESTPDIPVKMALHRLGLDVIWVRAVMHAISQYGTDKVNVLLKDDIGLNGLFDWEKTSEGWQFWDAVHTMVSD
jgi:hypothetical protein